MSRCNFSQCKLERLTVLAAYPRVAASRDMHRSCVPGTAVIAFPKLGTDSFFSDRPWEKQDGLLRKMRRGSRNKCCILSEVRTGAAGRSTSDANFA